MVKASASLRLRGCIRILLNLAVGCGGASTRIRWEDGEGVGLGQWAFGCAGVTADAEDSKQEECQTGGRHTGQKHGGRRVIFCGGDEKAGVGHEARADEGGGNSGQQRGGRRVVELALSARRASAPVETVSNADGLAASASWTATAADQLLHDVQIVQSRGGTQQQQS